MLPAVFISGGALMAIEIVGTRVIAPVFGVNLFIWSALLTVTLGALAGGYYLGGRAADRHPKLELMGAAIALAGALLALERVYADAVLGATEGMGPRAGALVAAVVLFAPALVALGATSPIAARLVIGDVTRAGRRTGLVYAVSTAGSLIATLAVGFWLVPALETKTILLGVAVLLAATGALLMGRRRAGAALGALLVPMLAPLAAPSRTASPDLRILGRAQSLYGLVEAIEDDRRHVRLLRVDHSVIGAVSTSDGSAAFSFLHLLEAARFARPEAKSLLQIGLGVGSLPTALERHGMRADVVELDPRVVEFARRFFEFAPHGDVFTEDARTYLTRTTRHYDLVVHDTFTGGTTPEHLLSREVIVRIAALLTPHGLLVLNFAGYRAGPHAEASFAVARTLHSVFPFVRAYFDSPLDEDPDEPGNLAFFAAAEPIDFRIPAGATFESPSCEHVQRAFEAWEVLRDVPAGAIVTDAHNPLARLQLPVAQAHFRAMRAMLPPAAWLD